MYCECLHTYCLLVTKLFLPKHFHGIQKHWREALLFFLFYQICRSPCGSGISGLLALLYHKELIKVGEAKRFINAKTRSHFDAKVLEQVKIKDTPAVITEMLGKAHYTGESTYYCEEDDPQPSFCIS